MKSSIITTAVTVIATATIEAIGRWIWDSSILGWCWRRTIEIGLTLIQPVSIPYFCFAILVLMSGALLLLAASKIRKEAREVSFYDYTEDSFDGLTWRWRYLGRGSIDCTWCYCPVCDTVLTYEEKIDYYGCHDPYVHFICDRHGEMTKLRGNRDNVVAYIERQIDRNVRTEDYKEVLKSKKPPTENT